MPVQYRVKYSGQVQGVGFRWTASQTASLFAVGGWVRNRADGTVELVAEGEAAEVLAFLETLRQKMSGRIQNEQSQMAEIESTQTKFQIRA